MISYKIVSNYDVASYPVKVDPNSNYNSQLTSNVFGSTERHYCTLCKLPRCENHWGSVAVKTPIYRPSYLHVIAELVKELCFHCGLRLKITEAEDKVMIVGKQHPDYSRVLKSLRVRYVNMNYKCENCAGPRIKLLYNYNSFCKEGVPISSIVVYNLLRMIPFYLYPIFTVITFPFEDLFWYPHYPIPPLSIRESFSMFNDRVYQSMITNNLIELITRIGSRDNQKIQEKAEEIELSKEIAPASNYCQSIKSKNNMFRKYIMSNRKNNSTRVHFNFNRVTELDSFLAAEEYYSTILERIYFNEYTMSLIKKYADTGAVMYYTSNEEEYRYGKQTLALNFGDYVEILCGSDRSKKIVLVSRFPVLHRGSLIGTELLPARHGNVTNCLNSHGAAGFNIDQDGDELNTYQPHTLGSQYEMREMMKQSKQLISDGAGTLTVGFIHYEAAAFIRWSHPKNTIPTSLLYSILSEKLSMIIEDWKLKPNHNYTDMEVYDLIMKRLFGKTYTFSRSEKEVGAYKMINTIFKFLADWEGSRAATEFFECLAALSKRLIEVVPFPNVIREYLDDMEFHNEQYSEVQKSIQEFNSVRPERLLDPNVLFDYFYSTMEKRYTEHLSRAPPDSQYFNVYYSRVKVDPKTIMSSFVLAPTEDRRQKEKMYLGRHTPVYMINSDDVRSLGYVTQPLMRGLTLEDTFNLIYPLWNKLYTISQGTKISGRLSRELSKNLMDVKISTNRFVTSYDTILDTSLNGWKMNNSNLYLQPVDFLSLSAESEYDRVILKHFNHRSYSNYFRTAYVKEILFPVNVTEMRKQFQDLNKTAIPAEEKTALILELANRIHKDYLLCMCSLNKFLVAMMMLLREDISHKFWKLFEENLIRKYETCPNIGEAEGLQTAVTIGEGLTQETLSNFHVSKKTGEDINIDASKDVFNYIHLRSESHNGVVVISASDNATDKAKLHTIKNCLEYITLDLLGVRFEYDSVKNDSVKNNLVKIRLMIDYGKMQVFSCSLFMVESIVTNGLDRVMFVEKYSIATHVGKEYLEFDIEVTLFQEMSDKNHILAMMFPSFSKGVYCESRFKITKVKKIVAKAGVLPRDTFVDEYELTMMNDDHSVFSMFDTSGLKFVIPPENVYKYFGKAESLNSLMNRYVGKNAVYTNHLRTIAKFQHRYQKPTRIKKINAPEISTLSKVSYENCYKDFQGAVIENRVESMRGSVASAIFTQEKVPLGTGYFDSYLDPGYYFKFLQKKEDEVGSLSDL